MSKLDLSTWTCTKLIGRIQEVCVSPDGEVVVLGVPRDVEGNDDESHNCDANGCGFDHVLWRSPKRTTVEQGGEL